MSKIAMQNTVPLSINNVSKTYSKDCVLSDISLLLENGEIFGLIGLNGAGKTTLIKIVLGLTSADSGNVEIFGQPHTEPDSHNSLVYLPEKFIPSKYLKGWEYLNLCCSYYNQELNKESTASMSELLDLPVDKLKQQVRSYSKGMAQKLGLLGTLIIKAPLIILDEPMSGLDPRARIMLKDQLKRAKNAGRSIFFSSHILSDLEEICDRIGILHQGKLIFTGAPSSFKQENGGNSLEQAFLNALEKIESNNPVEKVA